MQRRFAACPDVAPEGWRRDSRDGRSIGIGSSLQQHLNHLAAIFVSLRQGRVQWRRTGLSVNIRFYSGLEQQAGTLDLVHKRQPDQDGCSTFIRLPIRIGSVFKQKRGDVRMKRQQRPHPVLVNTVDVRS